MSVLRLVRTCVLAMGLLVMTGAPATAQDGDPSIAAAIEMREQLGFSTDPTLVEALANDPTANRDWGLPLTDVEAFEMERRAVLSSTNDPLESYVDRNADRFGQIWLDQAAGGVLVVEMTPMADEGDTAMVRSLVPAGTEVRFDVVVNSRRVLAELQDWLGTAMLADDPDVAGVTHMGVMIRTNVLEVGVLPERLEAIRALLAERGVLHLVALVESGYDVNT